MIHPYLSAEEDRYYHCSPHSHLRHHYYDHNGTDDDDDDDEILRNLKPRKKQQQQQKEPVVKAAEVSTDFDYCAFDGDFNGVRSAISFRKTEIQLNWLPVTSTKCNNIRYHVVAKPIGSAVTGITNRQRKRQLKSSKGSKSSKASSEKKTEVSQPTEKSDNSVSLTTTLTYASVSGLAPDTQYEVSVQPIGDRINGTRRELATTTATRRRQQSQQQPSYRKASVNTQKDDPIVENIVFHDLITNSCKGDYAFTVEEPSEDLVFVREEHYDGKAFGPCNVADIVLGIDTSGNPFLVQVTQLQDGRWIQSKRVSFSEAFKRFTASMDTVASDISSHETATTRRRNLVVSGTGDTDSSAFNEMGMVSFDDDPSASPLFEVE
jgi:hypothetical protein